MTHLKIEQNNGVIEEVGKMVIDKLYDIVTNETLDQTSNLVGRLNASSAYHEYIDEIHELYPELYITATKYYTYLGDPVFTQICATAWGDGVGCVLSDLLNVHSRFEDVISLFRSSSATITDARGLKYLTNIDWPGSHNNYHSGFSGFSNLEKIELPYGMTQLDAGGSYGNYGFFKNCSKLRDVVLPSSLTSIGENSFEGCTSLTEVVIPDYVTIIKNRAFINSGITSITLPTGLLTLQQNVFDGCLGLTSLHIPSSVTQIGASLLNDCYDCESITFDLGEGSALSWSSGLTYQSNVIGANTKIKTIEFPARLSSLGNHAFRNTNVTKLIFHSTTPPTLGNEGLAFSGTIYVPDEALSTYLSTSPWSGYDIYAISSLQT